MVLGKGGKGSSKDHANFGGAGAAEDDVEQMALLDQIKELNMNITFNVGGEIAMPILAVDNVSFNYPGGKTLFTGVDFGLNMDSRIALVGANGTGKSSLLKLMLQDLTPTDGEVRQSRMCRIGVYNQHSCDQLAKDFKLAKGEKLTPVAYLMHKFPEFNYQQVRNMLGRFGLEGHHHEQEIATLSGGQKSRVVFVELGMQRSHLLLLDEPTNHLDLETVDCLVTALRNFQGGVMVITHNMTLINAVCNECWIIEAGDPRPGGEGGTVRKWVGEFEEYRDQLAEELSSVVDEDPEEKARLKRVKEEKEARDAAAAARAAGEEGGEAKAAPKSKAQRDKERAEARAAARARDEAAAKAKKEAAEAEAAAKAAAEKAEAEALKAAAEAKLKHESDVAKAALVAKELPLVDAVRALVARCEGAEHACGGLLVLTQLHAPSALLAPLLAAIVDSTRSLGDSAAAADDRSGPAAALARRVRSWGAPLGWLVCRCDSLSAGQRALLAAVEVSCADRPDTLLPAVALVLHALWEANVLDEEEVASWAADESAAGRVARRARRFASPLVEWLRTAPDARPEAEASSGGDGLLAPATEVATGVDIE